MEGTPAIAGSRVHVSVDTFSPTRDKVGSLNKTTCEPCVNLTTEGINVVVLKGNTTEAQTTTVVVISIGVVYRESAITLTLAHLTAIHLCFLSVNVRTLSIL